MRTSTLVLASLLFGASSLPIATSADAKVRVVPFGKAGNWSVRAVFRQNGPFDHCSATATYRSGTRISMIVYRSGNWRLWFSHKDWPDRGRRQFSATLRVDNRVVYSGAGHFKNRNAYVDLGRDVERVKALMRGRVMAIETPSGVSRFNLTGTSAAARSTARCWKANYQTPSSGGGAFGGGTASNRGSGGAFGGGGSSASGGGAFGGGNTASRSGGSGGAKVLSRADTLELVTRYLGKSDQPYSILPSGKNPLKHFTVNWRYQSGTIGGMKVYRNTRVNVDRLLTTLLSDQAKYCSGRNASQKIPQRQIRGRQIAGARGVCETRRGSVLNIKYRVAELGSNMVMMIMEMTTKRTGGSASSGGSIDDGEVRQPKANEL